MASLLNGSPAGKAAEIRADAQLGLYLHIPFCRAPRCAYCDFYSEGLLAGFVPDTYINALLAEARAVSQRHCFAQFSTLYLGGGTPSLLSAPQLQRLTGGLRQIFSFRAGYEATIEVNPSDQMQPELWADCGLNRISLGVQSFDDRVLAFLGRRHRNCDTQAALARLAGHFEQLSIDIITCLPLPGYQQSLDLSSPCLQQATHLSSYQLTYYPGTKLHQMWQQGQLEPVGPDKAADLWLAAGLLLAAQGLRRYEISNFARPGCQAQHNLLYWQNQEYLGLGAGAASSYGGHRYLNKPHLAKYLTAMENASGAATTIEEVPSQVAYFETVMMGIRLLAGVDLVWLERRFGLPFPAAYTAALQPFIAQKHLSLTAKRLVLQASGLLLADDVALALVDL